MMCDSGTPFCINNAMACTAELPAKWQGMGLHAQIPELFVSSQAVVWKQRLLQKAYETLTTIWAHEEAMDWISLVYTNICNQIHSGTIKRLIKEKSDPIRSCFQFCCCCLWSTNHIVKMKKKTTCCKNWVQEQNMAISNVTWQLFIHKLQKCKKIPKPNKTHSHFI